MAGTIHRLRTGFVAAGVLLLLVLASYFVLARWKDRFLRQDLPRRLGINILQDSTGFTLSKSDHGKTLYTIHAARAVQMKNDGMAELQDVRIVLYGQGSTPRQDRITGDRFTYNQKQQVVTAQGTVLIDLQSLDAKEDAGSKAGMHLQTSGLLFDQKTAQASTAERVEFRLPQMMGTAVGADYDSEHGVLVLRSQVVLQTVLDGGVATVRSSHAVLNRPLWQLDMDNAALHTAKREASARQASVWLRQDGTADHMLAQGEASMTMLDGTELHAPRVTALFDDDSTVKQMHAEGGITLHQPAEAGSRTLRDATASEAWLQMGAEGKPLHLKLAGQVVLVEDQPGLQRQTLRAGEVRVEFHEGVAESMTATRSPTLEQLTDAAGGVTTKLLQADVLSANLKDGRSIEHLVGEGNSRITQSSAAGEQDTSTGDHLEAEFAATAGNRSSQVTRAIQTGSVRVDRHVPALPGHGEETSVAHADRAEYRESDETVVLTGKPRIRDANAEQGVLDLAAQSISLHRLTGDANADGAVQGSLVSRPGAEPAHVVAEHAVLVRKTDSTTFSGHPRLWQQGNSVDAPTIVLTNQPRGMTASASEDGRQPVHAVFVGQNENQEQKRPQPPVRVTAHQLVYTEADRTARFSGGVLLVDTNGTVRSNQAEVTFQPARAGAGKSAPATSMMGGNLERMVATGQVFLEQPLRQGTGEQLVYTAEDGKFVLTGTPGRPPRLEDRQQGTVSGQALQFLSHDERVDVLGEGGRTVTTTHMAK